MGRPHRKTKKHSSVAPGTRRHVLRVHTCHYCPNEAVEVDHIVPRSKGGRSAYYNLVPCCLPCNDAKANDMPTCCCLKCKNAVRLWRELRSRDDWWDLASMVDWSERGVR